VHPSRDTLPAALVFPVGQDVHATVPGLSEKEPGSHFWQVAEPNAEDTVPGSHLVHPEAPADEKVPAKQSEHVATEVAPSTAEDVPPAQTVLSFAHLGRSIHRGIWCRRLTLFQEGQYHPALTAHTCLSRALPTQKCPSDRTRAPIPWNPMRSNIPGQRNSSFTPGSL